MASPNRRGVFTSSFLFLLITIHLLSVPCEGKFLYFQPGVEYEYMFQSDARVKSLDTFHVNARVGYQTIWESDQIQEVYLRVIHLTLGSKAAGEGVNALEGFDFSRWFSFNISRHGEVNNVTYDVKDEDSTLAFKKGFAGLLASQLHDEENTDLVKPHPDGWQYDVTEIGHEGLHKASYIVKRSVDGSHVFTKTRRDHPVEHAKANYTKTIHYDKNKNIVHSVKVEEDFLAMDKSPKGFDPLANLGLIKTESAFKNIDIPEMRAFATGHLEFAFEHPRKAPAKPKTGLVTGGIVIGNEGNHHGEKVNVTKALEHLHSNLTCMRWEPVKGTPKLTNCFRKLRKVVESLPVDEISKLIKDYLSPLNTLHLYNRDRQAVLDSTSTIEIDSIQKGLVDTVLLGNGPELELVNRYLLHLASMDNPSSHVVKGLESLVFEPEKYPEVTSSKPTNHRAILALGGVARTLQRKGEGQKAKEIATKIHDLLGLHDPHKYRSRRSFMSEEEARLEDMYKVVLLEALGNVGHPGSYDVIVSHVNDSNSQWVKRAGMHAMRSYGHEHAANTLMMNALYDEQATVRYEASRHYSRHTLADPVVVKRLRGEYEVDEDKKDDSTAIESDSNRRVRRATRTQQLEFDVHSPNVDWTKLVGSKDIGASFGVAMKNRLDYKSGLLDGEMEVDIYDEAFARVNLGVLNTNADIMSLHLCFKGKADYDVNMLQEYDSDEIPRLTGLYDSLKENVTDSIVNSLARFRTIIDSGTTVGVTIKAYSDALLELPDKVLHIGETAVSGLQTLGGLDMEEMPSFVGPLWRLANKVINIYNDIKNDVMGFYMTLLHTTTDISFGVKQVFASVSDIVDQMEDFNDDPKAAIAKVSANTVVIGEQIQVMLSALREAKENAFFVRKTKPHWWNLKQEKDELNEMAVEAVAALSNEGASWVSGVVFDDLKEFSDGLITLTQLRQTVLDSLSSIPTDLINPFGDVSDLGDDLQDAFSDMLDLMEDMKNAYEDLRIGVKTAHEMVNRVYGPRVHPDFPKVFRTPGGRCGGSGMYVSSLQHSGGTTQAQEYARKGIDLLLGNGQNVVAPFSGHVMRSANNSREITLVVNAGLLKDMKVYIQNVVPAATVLYQSDPDYLPNFVVAGDVIGTASRYVCSNHIHVSITKEDRAYLDPTPYLEPRTPSTPTWTQECDDYKFVYKGVTVSAGSIVSSAGRLINDTSPTRAGSTVANPSSLTSNYNPSVQLDVDIVNSAKLGKQIKDDINDAITAAAASTDEGLQKLVSKPKIFAGTSSLKDLKVGSLAVFLEALGKQTSLDRLHSVFQGIQDLSDYRSCTNPYQMADDKLRDALRIQGKSSTGTRAELVDRFLQREDACMTLSLGLPDEMYCKMDEQCMGVECCLTIKLFMFQKNYKFYTRYDPCGTQLIVGIDNLYETAIGPALDMDDIYGGFRDLTLTTGIKEASLNAELILKMSLEKSDTQITISASAGFCRDGDWLGVNCMLFMTIMDKAVIPLPVCGPAPRRTLTFREVDLQAELRNQKEKFSEDSKKILTEEVDTLVTSLSGAIPCLSADANSGSRLPCARPDKMTEANLIRELGLRGLSTAGSKADLVTRLETDDHTCTKQSATYTMPSITNATLAEKVYLSMSDDCLYFEACVDFEFQNFPMSVRSSMRLDECTPSLVTSFQECTNEMVLFSYNLNTTGQLRLTDNFIVDYEVQKDVPNGVFIFDLSLKVQPDASGYPVVDGPVVDNLLVPIPDCNSTNYDLPTSVGTFSSLATAFGGSLSTDMVAYLFKMWHLDSVLTTSCSLPAGPACPINITVSDYLPSDYLSQVQCVNDADCQGIVCCMTYDFSNLPLLSTTEVKAMEFKLKFDPCDNMKVTVRFGNFFQTEELLDYEFGREKTIAIGRGENVGDAAPVVIRYRVSRLFETAPNYDEAFIVDASISVGIPMDGTVHYYPAGGLTLMDNERIEICPAANSSQLAAFDLTTFASDLGEDASGQLTDGTVQMIINEFGLTPYLKKRQCNIAKSPYIPNLRGWRDDCENPLFNLPLTLGDNTVCHMSSSCSRVDCCFYSPILDMSFNAFFDLNVCNYYIQGGIENKIYPIQYLLNETDSLNWSGGVNGTYEISNALRIEYNIQKDADNFILDVALKLCLGNDCQHTHWIYRNTRIPQLDCDASSTQSLEDVSFQFWKWEGCDTVSPSGGCQIALPANSSNTCTLINSCQTIHCCEVADLVVATKGLEFTFTSDVCAESFSFTLEGKTWTRSIAGIQGITNQMVYIVESVGEAINVTVGVMETATGLTVSADVLICTTQSSTTSCTTYTLLSGAQIYDPRSACVGSGKRRKRSVVVDFSASRDTQMLTLINSNATTADIESYFSQLEDAEASRCSQMRADTKTTVDVNNPKAILEAMGDKNPSSIVHCPDDSILTASIEGVTQIEAQMDSTTDIAGRTGQIYIPGKGLSKRGTRILARKVANMTLGELTAWVMSQDNMQPELVIELLEDMRQLLYSLYSDSLVNIQGGGVTDQFTSSDLAFDGTFSVPRTDGTFMRRRTNFLVGGLVPMSFKFTADISYGVDMTFSGDIMNRNSFGQMEPYASLAASGSLDVGVVLKGNLELDGTICHVRFPSQAEANFGEFPLDLELDMDLELIPLELKLEADISVELSLSAETVTKSLYNDFLWHYRTPSIRKRVLHIERKEEDLTAPEFILAEDDGVTAITTVNHCQVRQLPDLDYTDPRIEVIVDAGDDRSKVRLTLDIGTSPGLSDVRADYEMGGPQIVITESLTPTGVPMYFRVTATNTGGVSSFVTCFIPTYDVTLPNGRFTADFKSSSNAHILKASAVIYEDSELVSSRLAVGLGRNIFSDGVQGYQEVNFTQRTSNDYDASGDSTGELALEHFTGQKIGRLITASSLVFESYENISSPGLCAKECLSHSPSKCMSFNYDSNGDCHLLEAIESHDNALALDGLYRHYERLSFGLATEFTYPIELTHNTVYSMVLHLVNVLGFEKLLSTDGTIVDITPPDPTSIIIESDNYTITDCESNFPEDRRDDWKIWCIGIDPLLPNHRTIVDADGSMTIFNGHEPLVDLRYTKDNTYISANWDGIHDYESGILGYSFAVGTTLCGEEVMVHHDPFKHLLPLDDDSQWTGIGVIEMPEGEKLPDGRYYVTVRAINQVEYGGPLVTTFCHSTPLAIDNSPPIIYEIYNIKYDDVSFNLTASFNATDPESDIKSVYMCLGLNAINCDLLGWTATPSLSDLSVTFQIPDGQRAWIRLRITNNVDLRTDAVADYPIIVDNGGPNAGTVYDGNVVGVDLVYSSVTNQFCANWQDFYDEESGIEKFYGQVVNNAGSSISQEVELASHVESTCVSLSPGTLQHNNVYKYRLTAINSGHKQLNVTVDSNGVLIDTSNPTAGDVIDGQLSSFTDQIYSVSVSTVSSQWRNFADSESTVTSYMVKVSRYPNLGLGSEQVEQDWDTLDNYTTTVEYNHLNLRHRDVVRTTVRAINGALGTAEAQSNGVIIDLTPPIMTTLFDGSGGSDIKYTSTQGSLSVKFAFTDAESGIERYKFQVYQTYQGSRHQLYPSSINTWSEQVTSSLTAKTLTGFSMSGGAHYSIRVAAINNAGAVSMYDTDGVIFDNTNPTMGGTMKVGAFSSESEVLVAGYVHQADNTGIKTSFSGVDSESGIQYFEVAVGTSQYATNILSWRNVGIRTDVYIDGLSLSTNTPYYVSARVTNGAGMQSSARTSNPVKVMQENRAGTVTDGPIGTSDLSLAGTTDIDFQKDRTTVTAQFKGFASYLHGIVRYDWAIGTTSGGEEIQPFMTAGLMHDEAETGVPGNGIATRGVAHAAIALEEGVMYYTTVRGITNDGTVLQSTSNGFKVDRTPPTVSFVSYAQETSSLSEGDMVYRQDLDTLSAEWEFSDSLNSVTGLSYKMGSYPSGAEFVSVTDLTSTELLIGAASLPANQIVPEDDGRSNIMTVTVMDEVGLTKTVVSPSLVIDTTAPSQGILTCPAYIQTHNPIECTWVGFHDPESPIVSFDFEITVGESLNSIHSAGLDYTATSYITPNLHGTVKHGYTYNAIVTATNELGLTSSVTSDPISIDSTPPIAGTVVEVSNSYTLYLNDSESTEAANVFNCDSNDNCTAIDATCQESLTSVYVAWSPFTDPETSIVAYQIAIGTSPGGGQIRNFFYVPVNTRYYQINDLDLNGQRQIYVSVKGFNGAGMATVSTSNGVYISYISQGITPPSPFSVWDQDSLDGDIDYQTSRTTITARWDVSGDPCPVQKYEWAIERVDGVRVQEYYDSNGQTYGLNDDLRLIGVETYYQLLRVTTHMNNFTYTLRSDGVTIIDQPLYPGFVYDGDVTDIDLQFQPFKNKISANWDGFGEKNEIANNTVQVISGNAGVVRQDRPPNQEIVRYEVAVGTDRRFENTRDDIVAWTDLALNQSVTFYDLELTPDTAIYYFTVRAYSTANTMAEVTSNGFSVGFDTGVTGGVVVIGDYVNASTTLPLKWEDFHSDVEMLIYYVAISSASVPVIDCDHVIEGGPMLDADRIAIFDVVDRTNVGENTYTEIGNINLAQDTDYWISVIGVDEAGKCKIITKQIHIDTTSPMEGKLKNGPYYDMAMSYTPYLRSIEMTWENYTDAESGLGSIKLDLYKQMSCSPAENRSDEIVTTITIDGMYTSYTFLDMDLNMSQPYYVIMTVYNKAALHVITTSPVILVDPSTSSPGTVVDGNDPLSDRAWSSSVSEAKATILYLPESGGSHCPPQSLLNTDASWNTLDSEVNNDQTGRVLNLIVRDANVQKSTLNPEDITIKLARDTSTNDMYTGAIYRDADLAHGGKYEMDIRAASGAGHAVTSVLFWDGPQDYVTHYDYTVPNTAPYCSCCDDSVPTATCESVCGGCNTYKTNRMVAGKRKKRATNQVMQLTASQKQTLMGSSNVNSINLPASTNPSQPACGMQIYRVSSSSGRLVLWCTFSSEYSYEPRSEAFDLSFDPSVTFHHYTIDMYSVADEAANPTWCMDVAIDGSVTDISLCGLPQLSTNTTLMMSVWNWKNYVPSVNVASVFATLWSAEATFRNIIVPADNTNLCRYEVPFRGGDDGFVSFEAGIGSDVGLDDLVPFRRVEDPCIPCLTGDCNRYHCNSTCSADTTNSVTLTLSGMNLPLNFTDSDGASKPRTYFYTVKGMLASGLSSISSSDGFSIDVTAPDFDTSSFFYLDMSHEGEIRPAQQYLGSESTMKNSWECQDAESDVVDYSWAIGTTIGGEEVQAWTSVGLATEGINSNLTGILTDNVMYYTSVRCTNGAGLTTTHQDTSGITVTLTPPDLSSVSLSMVGMSSISGAVPSNTRYTSNQNQFQLDFTVDSNPDVDEYYFKICSQDTECDDIFERTLVSNRQSGRLWIYNGRLYKDGQQMFELQQVKSDYNSTLASSANSDAFHVEPGRQIFPYMDGCTEAQCNTKSFGAIIIMNARSSTATSVSGESISTTVSVSNGLGKRRKKRSASAIDIITPSGLAAGQSIVKTDLLESDMTDSYDSAAGSGFVPIITSPASTLSNSAYLDRILYNRMSYNTGTDDSFTLTSVGDIEMPGPLIIDYPFDSSDHVNTWQILHWNPSTEKWQLSHETCTDETDTYVENSNSITIKVCNTRGNDTHNSTYTYFREETQFLYTDVLDLIPNTNPTLDSSLTNSMDEDAGSLVYQLESSDSEGDTVSYVLDDSVSFSQMNGELNMTSSGLLLFTPCEDCYGDYKQVIKIEEDPIAGITSLTSTYTLTITVNSINDAPVAFAFLDGDDLLHADPTEPVEVLLEEKRFNTSDNTNYTFIFGAYDRDNTQTLTVYLSEPINGTLTLVSTSNFVPTCSSVEIPCNNMSLSKIPEEYAWVYKTYNYMPNDDYWGIDPAQIYVQDDSSALSSVITMNFSVMARPCLNDGECGLPENASYTCENVNRAVSFEAYYVCNCTSGFEGTYCEIDTDECATDPCKWPYVCQDGVDGYTCICPSDNPECDGIEGWMIGIIVVCVIVLILLVLVMWYFFAFKKGRLLWSRLCCKKGAAYRRSSFDSGSDVPAKNENFNFYNKNYQVEEQDEDGFNSVFKAMQSPLPDKPMSRPSTTTSLPPIPDTGAMVAASAAPAATAATNMKSAAGYGGNNAIANDKPTTSTAGNNDNKPLRRSQSDLPAEETITPPVSSRAYIPRVASSTSMRRSSIARRSSTSSWLNSLLNNSEADLETPRSSRPITPIEDPPIDEDDEDQEDATFFF